MPRFVVLTSFTWRAFLNSWRSICRSLPATIENCCSNQASHLASRSMLCLCVKSNYEHSWYPCNWWDNWHYISHSRKLTLEKTFANWWFSHRKLFSLVHPKDTKPQNFAEKTFVNSHKTLKFEKVFSLKSFSPYNTMLACWRHPIALALWDAHCSPCPLVGRNAPETLWVQHVCTGISLCTYDVC